MDEEKSLSEQVDELLEEGLSPKEIREMGFSDSLVRQRLKKRQRRLGGQQNAKDMPITRKEKESVVPEYLMPVVAEVFDGDMKVQRAYAAGVATVLLGARLFAESYKPFLEFQHVLQQNQIDAMAASLAHSKEIASAVTDGLRPALGELREAVISASPNPLQSMAVNLLTPYLQNLLARLMKPAAPQGTTMDSGGFTFETRKREDRGKRNE